jgi:hypothetical protein
MTPTPSTTVPGSASGPVRTTVCAPHMAIPPGSRGPAQGRDSATTFDERKRPEGVNGCTEGPMQLQLRS